MMDDTLVIDGLLKEKIKNCRIPCPVDYDAFIEDMIQKGLSETGETIDVHRRPKVSKRFIVILVAVLVLALGIAVSASIDYYQKRMNTLSEQEISELLRNLDQSSEEAATYSRPLSEEEKGNFITLCEKYLSEGMFPEKSIKIINSLEEVRKDEVSFYPPKSYYYLPERILTNEELLEMIDFMFKADFALRKRAVDNQPIVNLNEEVLKEKALSAVRKVFDVELKEYSISLSKQIASKEGGDMKCPCDIVIRDKEYGKSYLVLMEGTTGEISSVDLSEKNVSKQNASYDVNACSKVVMAFMNKAFELHGGKSEIERMYFKTELKDELTIDGENIILDYRFKDGSWCRFYYKTYSLQLISWEDGLSDFSIDYDDVNEQKRCKEIGHEYIIVEVN